MGWGEAHEPRGGNPHNPGGRGLGELPRVELEGRVLAAERRADETLVAFRELSEKYRSLRADIERLTRERDEAHAAGQRPYLLRDLVAAEARVATLEAAAERVCEADSDGLDDAIDALRAALGDQVAPTEPTKAQRHSMHYRNCGCLDDGAECCDPSCCAPQVAPEPERRDEWRVVDDEGLVCCTEIVDLDDAHATAEMLDRDNPPERHHVERAVVTWERVPARWSAPRGEQP